MKYGIAYRIKFKNAERNADFSLNNQTVTVMIYDRSLLIDDSEDTDITDLIASDDPLHISTVDNSEDKFTGIKALQATISFKSQQLYNLATFADAAIPTGGTDPGDPRWAVNISISDRVIFQGFLNIDDCSAPFMPYPETVTLTANDGLAVLKNKPLTDFSGATPRNYNRLIDYIVWALSKTGLSLNLNVEFNIREANNKTTHLFHACYLWAKTFEDEIGTCENCYSVLEKILTEEAFLTQRNGEWWIVRVDDLGDDNTRYVTTFDSEGVILNENTVDYSKTIQRGTEIYFSQESTNVALKRPHNFIKETYRFEFPREIVDNIDFSREEDPYFTENFTEDGIAKVRKRYRIADWKLLQNFAGTPTSTATAYIERIFVDGYEKERFAAITPSVGGYYYIQSNPIEVHEQDKFSFSVDARYSDDFGSTGHYTRFTAQIRLYADDSTYWTLEGGVQSAPDISWKQTSANFSSNNGYVWQEGSLADDLSNWYSASVEAQPIPRTGYIVIQLLHADSQSLTRCFQNLRFDYTPYINGSYAKYSALYHKVSRTIEYTAKRDKTVAISDGLKKLFKGALFTPNYVGLFSTNTIFLENSGAYYIAFQGSYLSQLSTAQTIRITGSVNNNFTFNILEVQYNGTYTTVRVNKQVVTETTTVNVDRVKFSLADQFYNYQVYPSTVPDDAVHPYAHLQAFDVWNQFRNTVRKFEFTAQGLTSGSVDAYGGADLPHLNYRYTLGDTSDNTSNRVFMLLTFDWDLRLCEWTGTMVEVFKTDVGKFYEDTDNLEIKYVQ